MGIQQQQAERIEALRGLIERLSAPDLSLAEATVLRGQLSDLLEAGDRREPWNQASTRSQPAA